MIGSILLALLLTTASFAGYATEQAPDRLVIGKDTLLLHALPLEQWQKQNNREQPFFPDSHLVVTTGCWRGYIAYWELIGNRLYLINIFNCNLETKVDLNTLFAGKVHDKRVYADWFSDTVTVYKGDLIFYEHNGFSAIYEHELEFVFANGTKMSEAHFDNSLSKNTPAVNWRGYGLIPSIDSLINWAALPPLEKEMKVVLWVQTDAEGKPDSIHFEKSETEPFNQEALRVLDLIAHRLPVIYKRGQFIPNTFALSVIFTPEKQRRFMR